VLRGFSIVYIPIHALQLIVYEREYRVINEMEQSRQFSLPVQHTLDVAVITVISPVQQPVIVHIKFRLVMPA
jgi:hypothetical protein